MDRLLRFGQLMLQRCVLAAPKLSEIRLASDRTLAMLKAWHYIARARIEGDYLEFGVFDGSSFDMALRAASKFVARAGSPRFFAFDSFEGLPAPDEQKDGRVFARGEYRSRKAQFLRTIRRSRAGWDVRIVEGFYDKTLTADVLTTHGMAKAAFVNIDCDLYQSTLDALRFVTPLLQTGTVLYFDDWFFAGGDMRIGEPGACRQWLAENPRIELIDYGTVAVMGKMFLVQRPPV